MRDHPRIRGEHHQPASAYPLGDGSSPHTRGAPSPAPESATGTRIIPAYAGSTTPSVMLGVSCRDHPRIRGEHGERVSLMETLSRIIPAYAGSTPGRRWCDPPPTDHPRIRGEHSVVTVTPFSSMGSSPHTRGAPTAPISRRRHSGIIPAYAGSTPCGTRILTVDRDHPRIRGEHGIPKIRATEMTGSSPHTRGAPRLVRLGAGQ